MLNNQNVIVVITPNISITELNLSIAKGITIEAKATKAISEKISESLLRRATLSFIIKINIT